MLPASTPLVVRTMLNFKAQLLAGESDQIERMARQWLRMEQNLQGSIDALALEIANMRDKGETINISRLIKMDRYQSLLKQITQQLDFYTNYAEREIVQQQKSLLSLGISHAIEAIKSIFTMNGKVASAFDILPVSALTNMIGLAGDGSPLKKLLQDSWPEAVQGLTNQLIDGIALGINPKDVAKNMVDGFGVGLDRAMNIARTEELRAYRNANLQQYQASGMVSGYQRLAARDTRVCPACLFADDGTIYALDYSFDAHPQCRCTLVPVVIGMPIVSWQDGMSWFMAQNTASQSSILGPGAYDAWLNDEFELADMISRKDDDIWGGSLVTTSLADLLK